MANTFDFQQRFDQLIEMNEQAFLDGHLDLAYHALLTAFECANSMKSSPMMDQVSVLAQDEMDWIDKNQSSYRHSTKSAAMRHGGLSIYQRLSNQATRVAEMQRTIQRFQSLTRKY